jgi:hypothetical protein
MAQFPGYPPNFGRFSDEEFAEWFRNLPPEFHNKEDAWAIAQYYANEKDKAQKDDDAEAAKPSTMSQIIKIGGPVAGALTYDYLMNGKDSVASRLYQKGVDVYEYFTSPDAPTTVTAADTGLGGLEGGTAQGTVPGQTPVEGIPNTTPTTGAAQGPTPGVVSIPEGSVAPSTPVITGANVVTPPSTPVVTGASPVFDYSTGAQHAMSAADAGYGADAGGGNSGALSQGLQLADLGLAGYNIYKNTIKNPYNSPQSVGRGVGTAIGGGVGLFMGAPGFGTTVGAVQGENLGHIFDFDTKMGKKQRAVSAVFDPGAILLDIATRNAGSGKGPEQISRDNARNYIRDNTSIYEGKDGLIPTGNDTYYDSRQAQPYTNSAGEYVPFGSYNIDWSRPREELETGVGAAGPLATALIDTGANNKLRQDIQSEFANAIMSGQDPNTAIQTIYGNSGMDRNQIAGGIWGAYKAGNLTDEERDAYLAETDLLFGIDNPEASEEDRRRQQSSSRFGILGQG